MRKLALVLFLLAVTAGVQVMHASATVRPTVDDVAQGLTCQCGCGLTVANCNHPNCEFAVPAREQIAKMLAHGMSRVEIISFFRHKYGEKVLSSPTTQGFNLLAWTMPFVAIGIGAVLLFFLLERWRRATPSLPSGPEAVAERLPVMDPRMREQLEKEIREQL
jgi:cytochrome c-type biogenesis protein CcmH